MTILASYMCARHSGESVRSILGHSSTDRRWSLHDRVQWMARQVSLVLIVGLLFASSYGCSESHQCSSSESGVDGCLEIRRLSDEEVRTYCEWEYSLHESPGLRVCERDGGTFSVPLISVEACVEAVTRFRSWGCEFTVAEWEACRAALAADVCALREPVCGDHLACSPADAGVSLGDGGT